MGLPYETGLVIPALSAANVVVPGGACALFADADNGNVLSIKRSDGTVSRVGTSNKRATLAASDATPQSVALFTFTAAASAALVTVKARWRSASSQVTLAATFGITYTVAGGAVITADGSAAPAEGASVSLSDSGAAISLTLTGDGAAGTWDYDVDYDYSPRA